MKFLVTGGAGFIGRWVVKKILDDGHQARVIDNLSNGSVENIKEFEADKNFLGLVKDDIRDINAVEKCFEGIDICLHLAAQINVQESLDYPERAFENNVIGTYNILESARKRKIKVVLMGTCMVYDLASGRQINENHRIKPASPYAGSKVAAESLAESYWLGLGLPIVIVRPFNTYGPYQKSNMEGGVVSIFLRNKLDGKPLQIYGDGTQTRDLLYVEDCADFIYTAAMAEKAVGEIINAGTGKDISVNELAKLISGGKAEIKHVPHHHPQAEIKKLQCDYSKAMAILGWEPATSLEEGIKKTEEWLKVALNK